MSKAFFDIRQKTGHIDTFTTRELEVRREKPEPSELRECQENQFSVVLLSAVKLKRFERLSGMFDTLKKPRRVAFDRFFFSWTKRELFWFSIWKSLPPDMEVVFLMQAQVNR